MSKNLFVVVLCVCLVLSAAAVFAGSTTIAPKKGSVAKTSPASVTSPGTKITDPRAQFMHGTSTPNPRPPVNKNVNSQNVDQTALAYGDTTHNVVPPANTINMAPAPMRKTGGGK